MRPSLSFFILFSSLYPHHRLSPDIVNTFKYLTGAAALVARYYYTSISVDAASGAVDVTHARSKGLTAVAAVAAFVGGNYGWAWDGAFVSLGFWVKPIF